MRVRRTTGIMALLLTLGMPAAAQDRAGTVYVSAGLVVPYQHGPSGVDPRSYTTAAGGFTAAWSLAGGIVLGTQASVEVEFARTGRMTVREPSRDGRIYNDDRRDRFITFLTRFHIPVGTRMRIEPVAGAVVTSPEARLQVERDLDWLTNPGVNVVAEPWRDLPLRRHFGLMAGCDLSVGSPRLAFVSSFRFSDTGSYSNEYDSRDWETRPSQHYPGGYPRWTIRGGAGVRIAF